MSRMHRSLEAPSFERRGRAALRLNRTLSALPERYVVEFGRSAWDKPFDFFDEDDTALVRWRTTQAAIRLEGRIVGAIEFAEYEAAAVHEREFFDVMDAESYEMARVASVLLSAWRDALDRVLGYGRLLEIRWVWVEPNHPVAGIWIPVLEALMARVERYTAVVLAMAFPLEYEGKLPEGAPRRSAFERRRRAMLRYYERRLGLTSLPSPLGGQGWLWRPGPYVDDLIPRPRYRKGWASA